MLDQSPRRSVPNFIGRVGGGLVNLDVIREMFDSYIPILHAIPDDVPGQYSVLRRFAENWADRPITETIDPASVTLDLNPSIDLGIGVKHWIALNRDMDVASVNLLRDVPVTEWINDEALSLMILGEGDFYWAVRKTDLMLKDPPVVGFGLDYDCEDEHWISRGKIHGSIVEFAVSHMAYFIHRQGLNFVTQRVKYPQIVDELKDAFDFYSRIGDLHVFESEDIVAFVPGNDCLIVASWRKLTSHRIPAPIAV